MLRDHFEHIAAEMNRIRAGLFDAARYAAPGEGPMVRAAEAALDRAQSELSMAEWKTEIIAAAVALKVDPSDTSPDLDALTFDDEPANRSQPMAARPMA